ncbi:hypothetical protein ACJMK2_025019 [Sinanodonta woodiana]|uniref:Uncharacterized protein n=1 Tax=Sinanodonta woodiana TaxID=1069815 RepID=A0ABD3XJ13_SINWO
MFAKCAKQPHQFQYVKQKMRELARFLLLTRDTNASIISLMDYINRPIFKDVIRAARETCNGLDLFLKLGHSLNKCAGILKIQVIQAEDPIMKQKVVLFNRRGGETEIMEIALHVEGFDSVKTIQEELILSLTPFEQNLARQ